MTISTPAAASGTRRVGLARRQQLDGPGAPFGPRPAHEELDLALEDLPELVPRVNVRRRALAVLRPELDDLDLTGVDDPRQDVVAQSRSCSNVAPSYKPARMSTSATG